jgi:hypothetical protein
MAPEIAAPAIDLDPLLAGFRYRFGDPAVAFLLQRHDDVLLGPAAHLVPLAIGAEALLRTPRQYWYYFLSVQGAPS